MVRSSSKTNHYNTTSRIIRLVFLIESMIEVCHQIVDVLDAHTDADHVVSSASILALLFSELTMRGGRRVQDQRPHISLPWPKWRGSVANSPRLTRLG